MATNRNHGWSRATKSADNLKTIHHWTAYSILRPATDITCRRNYKWRTFASTADYNDHITVVNYERLATKLAGDMGGILTANDSQIVFEYFLASKQIENEFLTAFC